jgi:predicted Zn-dependent protease
MVKRVGSRVQKAAESYYAQKGMSKQLAGYKWEFNLVQDASANAFCMPGGKVVVNTGLLPITQTEDALAVVMGHEIAHALAHHGNERMSQQAAVSLGGEALNIALMNKVDNAQRNLFLQAYGAGAQLGLILPYSRSHESEADEIGLYLMAMAGYNPEAAAPLWERMGKMAGATPPAFLSTHPNPQTRQQVLAALVPKAQAYARMYGTAK